MYNFRQTESMSCPIKTSTFAELNIVVLRRYIAATHATHVQVWKTPSTLVREFAPFVLHRVYTGHYDDALSLTWSPDSQYALVRCCTTTKLTSNLSQMFLVYIQRLDSTPVYPAPRRRV